MNRREKILAIAVGLFVGLFVLYMAVDRLVLSDIKRLDQQEEKLLKVIKLEDRQLSSYQGRASRLEGLIDKTFGTDENLASERVRVRLDQLLKANELNISLKPVTGSKVQGQYREVGWAAIARGKIEQVVNFLYMLNDEPYLRRVDSLSLTPMHRSGQMEMKLRYLTLVSAEQKDRQLPPGQVAESTNPKDLDSEQRKQYDVIALRDPFRPYVKHVEPPKPPAPEPTPVAKKPEPKPAVPLKVVSLATWAGQQEVHLRNTASGKSEVLKPGDTFAGGKIVMIDYRQMPLPGKPEALSGSRVIFKKGNSYWAVELGQETAKEHRLATSQLPEELRSK